MFCQYSVFKLRIFRNYISCVHFKQSCEFNHVHIHSHVGCSVSSKSTRSTEASIIGYKYHRDDRMQFAASI